MDSSQDVVHDRRRGARTGPSPLADFLYDAFYGGAIGGSTIALVFLVVDAIRGQAFHTPSVLGSALFLGVPPDSVTGVRLDMVAYFTILHMLTFAVLGAVISAMVQRMHELALHPILVAFIIFVFLEGGFLLADQVLAPGVGEAIGAWWVALANFLTGWSMALFLLQAHTEGAEGYPEEALPE